MISPDAARAALVHKADGWFWGLIWSTIVLLVGVLMEEIHPLRGLHTHNVNVRTRARTPRVWVIRTQWMYEKLAIFLVILGIAGEGFCEFFGARAETAVRNFDNSIAVKAEGEAGAASMAAGSAIDMLFIVGQEAGDAQGKASRAGNEADAVGRQAAGLNVTLTADEREEDALQKALLPRGLDRGTLKARLGVFAGSLVKVETISDVECLRTAELIGTSLDPGAGWKVGKIDVDMSGGGSKWSFSGIEVGNNCNWIECQNVADDLAKALSLSGLPDVFSSGQDKSIPTNSFIIRVGLRSVPGDREHPTDSNNAKPTQKP